jgi:hypothetical protein
MALANCTMPGNSKKDETKLHNMKTISRMLKSWSKLKINKHSLVL